MRNIFKTLFLSLALLALKCGTVQAQPPGGMGGGPGGGQAMDPQQMQQQIQKMMVTFYREQLSITNDEEWSVIEPRILKVTQLRMESASSGGMGAMRGMMGRNRGGDQPGRNAGARPNFPGMTEPSAEATALQKAIDDKAPKEELKAAVAKFREWKKRKLAELAAAQEDLRQVLSYRQEAALVSINLLD